MKVLLFQGKSILSWLIRFQTGAIRGNGKYSHAAIELDDGTVIEAWANTSKVSSGVIHRKDFREGHTKGTIVDTYTIKSSFDAARVEQFLKDQIGKGYDWRSVLRFVTHKSALDNDRWFCSELVLTALAYGFMVLLKGNFSEMSPRDVPMSTLLEYEERRVV